jgi:hypothetical protein
MTDDDKRKTLKKTRAKQLYFCASDAIAARTAVFGESTGGISSTAT